MSIYIEDLTHTNKKNIIEKYPIYYRIEEVVTGFLVFFTSEDYDDWLLTQLGYYNE